MSAPNVLILDEPTNDLDIRTLTILEDYLDSFEGIVITVSHDRYFLERLTTRIFAFEGEGRLQQYEGGYLDYLRAREERDPELSIQDKKSQGNKKSEEQKKKEQKARRDRNGARVQKLKFSYKEQREYDTIEDEIAALEEKLEGLDQKIMENATNSAKLSELTEEKNCAEAELEEKMDRWVYLNDLAEKIKAQDSR